MALGLVGLGRGDTCGCSDEDLGQRQASSMGSGKSTSPLAGLQFKETSRTLAPPGVTQRVVHRGGGLDPQLRRQPGSGGERSGGGVSRNWSPASSKLH